MTELEKRTEAESKSAHFVFDSSRGSKKVFLLGGRNCKISLPADQ
jgi:hypothetical protein